MFTHNLCASRSGVVWKAAQHSMNEFKVSWYPYRGDAFTPYLWDRCLYEAPCSLYPVTHGGRRAGRSLPTTENKSWGEFAVGWWGDESCRELQLRWGHFSPVIALCGTSPGGTATAARARHIMMYCPRSIWPKCQTQLMKIWHIVQGPRGRYTKAYSRFFFLPNAGL